MQCSGERKRHRSKWAHDRGRIGGCEKNTTIRPYFLFVSISLYIFFLCSSGEACVYRIVPTHKYERHSIFSCIKPFPVWFALFRISESIYISLYFLLFFFFCWCSLTHSLTLPARYFGPSVVCCWCVYVMLPQLFFFLLLLAHCIRCRHPLAALYMKRSTTTTNAASCRSLFGRCAIFCLCRLITTLHAPLPALCLALYFITCPAIFLTAFVVCYCCSSRKTFYCLNI